MEELELFFQQGCWQDSCQNDVAGILVLSFDIDRQVGHTYVKINEVAVVRQFESLVFLHNFVGGSGSQRRFVRHRHLGFFVFAEAWLNSDH